MTYIDDNHIYFTSVNGRLEAISPSNSLVIVETPGGDIDKWATVRNILTYRAARLQRRIENRLSIKA